MLTDSTTGKIEIDSTKEVDMPDKLKAKAGTETHEAASNSSDSQESPLKAQQNNSRAKEAALGAIHRFTQESKMAEQKAKKMVSELEEVVHLALDATKDSGDIGEDKAAQGDTQTAISDDGVAESEKLLSEHTKSINTKVKAEFYHLLMTKHPRLRHFIDDLTEDKAKLKINKIVSEAKSEIVAARLVVNKAQEEINASKEEAKKALLESEATHKAAELIVSQVKKDAITQSADEIAKARTEVRAVQEVASEAIKRAEEEVKKSREEAAALSDYAAETLALAEEKVKKSTSELKAYKLQAQLAVKLAKEETKKARDEVEEMRREAKSALSKAAIETQQAKADMERARRTIQEAIVMAEKQAYDKICEEMKQMRGEVEITNKKAQEVISKAQSETQQAKQELESVKKNSEETLRAAREEIIDAKKEAEKSKQAIQEVINQAKEENRKIREEAEKSIIKANEVIVQAKKDVINMTKGEIIKTRQELESPSSIILPVEKKHEEPEKPATQNLNSEYVANVLHEMRNPLHSIAGFAKLMLDENVTDEKTRKEFLSIMVEQSENLSKLIDDMSHTLHDKGETFEINKEIVSPSNVISEAIDSVQGMAQQKKNLISLDLAPSLPEIFLDAFRIKQVIVNLLTNAIKYSPENSSIYIKAGVHDDELLVQVIDRGIGISQANIPALFSRYYQVKRNGDSEGVGLGLYICRQIIEAHGGRIWVESVEGEGSTFSFTLPIAVVR
jgi:signal transduction histidine kinase